MPGLARSVGHGGHEVAEPATLHAAFPGRGDAFRASALVRRGAWATFRALLYFEEFLFRLLKLIGRQQSGRKHLGESLKL